MLAVQLLNGRIHDRTDFDCGEPSLNHYLRDLAAQHHRAGVATTHVLIEESRPGRIHGFYSLAAAQLLLSDLSDLDRRRLPRYPVAAARLARLGVDLRAQGRGLGESLLQETLPDAAGRAGHSRLGGRCLARTCRRVLPSIWDSRDRQQCAGSVPAAGQVRRIPTPSTSQYRNSKALSAR